MTQPTLEVREIQTKDLPALCDYWDNSSDEHMQNMGVDLAKRPTREEMLTVLENQLASPLKEKKGFALIWEVDGQAIGHNNVNQIEFGKKAYMHLHLWRPELRQQGLGLQLLRLGIPIFFERLQLERLYCEPYALNPAPNKALEKLGFTFVQQRRCIPNPINFEQEVNQWVLERTQLQDLGFQV